MADKKPTRKAGSRPAAKKAGTRPVVKRKGKQPEPTPVVGGRFLIAALFVGLMVVIPMSTIGNWFQKAGPAKTNTAAWRKGKTSEVEITLVTADYNNLACASDKMLAGVHCGFKSELQRWPRGPNEPVDDNKKNIIQPYRTWPDNQLILVAGLWATREVAMRLHNEPPAGVPRKKLARFVATCKVHFLGQLQNANLQWSAGAKWFKQGRAIVGRALSCKVAEKK